MIRDYMDAAMAGATYKSLPEDGSIYGEIPALQGVWANADTPEACRTELEEVLEEWLITTIAFGFDVPAVEGVEEGSFPSSKHQFMVRGDTCVRVPATFRDEEDEDDDEIIGVELLTEILKQAGISREEWEAL